MGRDFTCYKCGCCLTDKQYHDDHISGDKSIKPPSGWWKKYEKELEGWPDSVELVIENGDIWGSWYPRGHNKYIPTGHFTRDELYLKMKEITNKSDGLSDAMEAIGIISFLLYEFDEGCVYITYE